MPNKLVKIAYYSDYLVEMSFENESPLDHKGDDFPTNSLTVKSKILIRCVERAYDSKESSYYESWVKEFGPLTTPGLDYWANYEPLSATPNNLVIAGVAGDLIAFDKDSGQEKWRKNLGDRWVRYIHYSYTEEALFVFADSNLTKVDPNGNTLWVAKSPNHSDPFVSFTEKNNDLTVFNLASGFVLDPKTGKSIKQWHNK